VRRENNWTIPNILTVFRIMLTPGFVMAFVSERIGLACILFIVASVTDALDGTLARVLKQRTSLGAMLDPLADKVLIVTGFLCLGLEGWVPAWLVVLVISRDMLIIGGLVVVNLWGVDVRNEIRPSFASKVNTTVQISLLFLVLTAHAGWMSLPNMEQGMIYFTGVLTVYTGFIYLKRGLALIPANGG